MSNEIKMVVFDMAGTTVNENNIVYKSLHKAISESSFSISQEQVTEHAAGREKIQAIRSILSTFFHIDNEEMVMNIYKNFIRDLGKAYQTEKPVPQNYAEEVFRLLKMRNIIIVLNTGYDRATAENILSLLGWKTGQQIDALVTASDVDKKRPDPAMIYFAMKCFDITDCLEVIKVGDSAIDIQEGQNAGCQLNIGITTGAHSFEQLRSASPDYIINDLMELIPLIDGETGLVI